MFQDTLVPRVSSLQRACLVLVVALLLFAAAAELVVLHHGTARRALAAHRTPVVHADSLAADRHLPPRTREGRVLVRLPEADVLAVTRDATDDALVDVVVPHGSDVVDCNLIAAHVTVARQDGRQVRLLVSGYEYVPAATARTGSGGTTCVTAGTASVPVRLRAPLAHRTVFVGRATRAVPVGAPGATIASVAQGTSVP